MVHRRRRGTAIVETKKGILVAAGRYKVFILPGGGARKFESRRKAAIRELEEETGLRAVATTYLFRFMGSPHKDRKGGYFQDHHKVFLVRTTGKPRPRHEVKYIAYYRPGCSLRISCVTFGILQRFFESKMSNYE